MAKAKPGKNVIQGSTSAYVNDTITVRTGETIDEFMVRIGVFDKLLSQIEDNSHVTDWEAELDELQDSSSHQYEEGDQEPSAPVSKRNQ